MTAKRKPAPEAEITIVEALRRKEVANCKKRELDLDIARGKYLLHADVERHWSRLVLALRNAMLAIPSVAVTRLQVTAEQAHGLDDVIREVLLTTSMTEPPEDEPTQ